MLYNCEYRHNGCVSQMSYKRLSTIYKWIDKIGIKDFAIAEFRGSNTYDKEAYIVIERGNGYKHSSEF